MSAWLQELRRSRKGDAKIAWVYMSLDGVGDGKVSAGAIWRRHSHQQLGLKALGEVLFQRGAIDACHGWWPLCVHSRRKASDCWSGKSSLNRPQSAAQRPSARGEQEE